MLIRAILINSAKVSLGLCDVPQAVQVVEFGGGTFIKTKDFAKTNDPRCPSAFIFRQADVQVQENLDPLP